MLVAQKPCGRWLNKKLCSNKSAIFVIFLSFSFFLSGYDHYVQEWHIENSLGTHCHFSMKLMLISCTQSLVPRPKTNIICLGARLVHKRNCKLASRQYTQLAWSLPVVADILTATLKKQHTTALVNCKARIVSCQYSFLCYSLSVGHVFDTESGWPFIRF